MNEVFASTICLPAVCPKPSGAIRCGIAFNVVKLSLLAILVCFSGKLLAGPRDAEWKKVEEAINKGLPKTAITNLEPIIQGALKDKAYAEAVKAIGKKIALEGNIQGNKPEEKITRLESEITKAPRDMVPVMNTLLAHWYWQYFQQNRWRFMQRTATAQAPGKDFTTWDLPRLFEEIDKQFQNALTAEKTLKQIPIAAWDDLLEKGTMPDSYRPTLYDFVAHEALDFYTVGEQAGTKAQDAFELSADSPILGTVDEFLAWNPTPQERSISLRAIHLYQELMRFHRNDPAPQLALASADLDRLTWGGNAAFGENKSERYKTALDRFIGTYADFDISALAIERKARVLQQEADLVAAHDLAEGGAKLFPQSPGGKLCRNLVTEIESKSANVTTERVWQSCSTNSVTDSQAPGACAAITIHYRNIERVYFRAIPYDWEIFLRKNRNRPESLNEQERREVLAKTPAYEWAEKLTPTTEYKEKTQSFTAPNTLKPGFYFIASSYDPEFAEKNNLISLTDIWVSDLSLVTRTREGKIEGFVLEANSGEPISGAEMGVWHLDNNGNRIADPTLTTDTNGFFSLKPSQNAGYLFRARHQGRELATATDLWSYGWQVAQPVKPEAQTVFFTDRAIYRPGQTIQFKGICLWVDQSKDNYEVLKGEPITVVFRDQNGKEIARQNQRANDYGSFTGSFTAPRDRLMGQMSVAAEGRARGQAWVRVEEYKRPKFEVTLDAPKTLAKLNEKVTLTGHAMSYTGAAVDSAQVRYRVVRQVRMPWWWGWWGRGWPGNESQEIAHGSVSTETDGSFKIVFVAKPDPKVSEKDEPSFNFDITADVTDSAGETRSAERGIRVGYTALEATLSAKDWQTDREPVEVTVGTRTLDSEPQVAEGNLKVYQLEAPQRVHRAPLVPVAYWPNRFQRRGATAEPEDEVNQDLSNPNNWPLGAVIAEQGFTTDTNGSAKLSFKLPTGAYRVMLEIQDRFGKKVTGRLPLQVLKPDDAKLAIKVPSLLASPSWQVEAGEEFMALWGTGYDSGRAFIEIEHRHQMWQSFWTKPGQTQQQVKLAVTEAMRGGFTIHLTQVRENRSYLQSHRVDVPWSNKQLELKWDHFVSKLQPAQKETWSLQINAPKVSTRKLEKSVAELVAALYDESLDAFVPHNWPAQFNIFRQDYSSLQSQFGNTAQIFQPIFGRWEQSYEGVVITYRSFPSDLTVNLWGYAYFNRRGMIAKSDMANGAVVQEAEALTAGLPAAAPMAGRELSLGDKPKLGIALGGAVAKDALAEPAGGQRTKPDLSQVTARKNLNETAFFFPQLTSDSNGAVRMTFTMPEALTKWHFLGFAHDGLVRSGLLEAHAFTSKDLMVQPNPPRFLREGDTVEFTVKVSNQSDKTQTGAVNLSFTDALTGKPADQLLRVQPVERASSPAGSSGLRPEAAEQTFTIAAKQSRTFSWRITVPDGCGFLTYKTVGVAANVSDGEEGAIPVLSRRILITESLPLPIRGPATKKFEFTKLLKSGSSKTLENKNLTVQMVSNPAWYAVLALPYLMEYPYECSEQTFNRLYANALARNIANSDTKIHRIFEQWKNTPTLDSPLEKNQDLKSVALEETPWLRQAQSEGQARKNVGILFDDNRLNYEVDNTLQKLAQMQLNDGSWPWFPGGRGNDYITLYIVTGFGRLRHLGVDLKVDPAIRALNRLDNWMTEEYERIQANPAPEKYVPSATDALYLYGRSFFLKDQPIAASHKKAVEFLLTQSRKFWLQTDCRQTQGQLALALARFNSFAGGNDSTPLAIMKSLKERSVSNEEMGMFWRDTELSWWWYRAPIETQALMIEAFDEVAHDAAAVEDCKVWLLKQKQTQDWKTTKATADAVYALLLRGRELLSSEALVEVTLGGKSITPSSRSRAVAGGSLSPSDGERAGGSGNKTAPPIEPGTGFYEVRFAPADIKPKLGEITVKKTDQGVAWGSVHWQYLEDMTKVTPYEGTPLKLKKALFTKKATSRGPMLEPVKGSLEIGEELVVRIELRVDRDMEYVHLKDQRGSGTEPVNVLSQYKYQDGLAYYESTRDTASHFFIDYLPKGTYVFEYSTRVQLRGQYQTGVAQIQCMYAPEFNSHSQSIPLAVK
ncbi:MAG TPA: MG2 domain-containing protein [Candidatus Limnocylindrales bacterium]|nr:MG2 domain-containing protein [Candidatus Limnocylindrales bacterium]